MERRALASRTPFVLLGLTALLAFSGTVGLLLGAVPLDPEVILAALFGRGDAATVTIVRDLRLPRVFAAALVGAALAVAGALLQGLTRNPLADPYVTGSSAGAALGAILAVAVLGPLAGAAVPLAAFAGALVAVAAVWQVARLGGRTTVLTVLLAGVVFTSFAGAVITLLLVASDRFAIRVRSVIDVLVGAVTIRGTAELVTAAAIVVIGIALAIALAPRVDAYAFGEETAATLGVDTDRTTGLVLAASALLSGAAVALAGLVGFVGLVVPHAMRAVVGAGHRRLIPTAALAGASFLVIADAGARIALAPAELPVGVVTGIVGAPFFLVLLVRSRRMLV
jgi:iron complex transport system permease protein